MSRTKGTYTLTSNIEPKVGAPLDARTIVKLKTDLTANGTFEYPYKGLTVFVEEESKKYTLIGIDPTVLTNWTEESGSGGGHTIEKSDGTDMTSRTNLQFIDAQISDDSNNNRTKVENVKVISSESELADLPDGIYISNSEESVNVTAVDVIYDNTTSGLDATTVQEAIDEVVDNLGSGTADGITYDNTISGLEAEDVQDALDEIAENLGSGTADGITYDNTVSGLEATTVQEAIDEIVDGGISSGHTIEKSDGTDMTQRTNLQFLDAQLSDDSSNDRTKIENVKTISSESELANLPDGIYLSNTDEQTYVTSADVTYDNTTSGLEATTVQEAIDLVAENSGSGSADGITYDNTESGLSSTNVQDAIDEVVDSITGGHTIEQSDGTDMTQRTNLQFLDAQVSDDSTNDRTKIENIKVITSESQLASLPDGIYISNTEEQTYVTALDVTYDASTSGLDASTVQEAIDLVAENSGSGSADGITYDNTESGLSSTNVQDAIDEVAENSGSADGITYDNTTSGLIATNVQDAIDEIVDGGISSGHTIEKSDGTDMTQRTNLQFLDAQVSDDSTNDRTKIENIKVITSESQLASLPDGIYISNTEEQTYVTALDVTYNNEISGLASNNVQDAIDELKSTIESLQNTISQLQQRINN